MESFLSDSKGDGKALKKVSTPCSYAFPETLLTECIDTNYY